MAKQQTVLVLTQTEVEEALADYAKKHYDAEADIFGDVYVIGYSGTRDTIDKVEIVLEEEDIDDVSEEETGSSLSRRNDATIRTIDRAARPDVDAIDFSDLGGTRPRAANG